MLCLVSQVRSRICVRFPAAGRVSRNIPVFISIMWFTHTVSRTPAATAGRPTDRRPRWPCTSAPRTETSTPPRTVRTTFCLPYALFHFRFLPHFLAKFAKNGFVCRRRGFSGVAAGHRAERTWCRSYHGNRRHHQLTPAGPRHGCYHGNPGWNHHRRPRPPGPHWAAGHHGYRWQRAAAGGYYGMDGIAWLSELKSFTCLCVRPAGCHSNVRRHHDRRELVAVPAGGAASHGERHTDRSTGQYETWITTICLFIPHSKCMSVGYFWVCLTALKLLLLLHTAVLALYPEESMQTQKVTHRCMLENP